MTATPATHRAIAPGPPDFALHTLGRRAFPDLCAAVLRLSCTHPLPSRRG
jgi:hypothetical protein